MATKLGSLTLDLICRTGNFTQGMRDASNSASRELGRIEQSTNSATNAIKGLAVAALGSFSIHQVIAYTDSYTNLQNRLKLVTNSHQELSTATKDTFDIAQATAQSWGSVAQVYQRFAENSSRLGITMQQTASLTDTVSKAISISGASAASAEAALMQFGQALASGVLRGEEFNSIAEQAPALLKAIATGLGVNIGELRKMAGEGQLTGDVVIKALTKAKTSVDDLFSKTDFTIAQSFTQLNDSVTKFVGEAGQGSGAAKTLASSIKLVADNVDTIADVAMVGGVAFLTKTVISQTIAMKESIVASMQRRLADTAALESQVRLSALEVQRMRQVTALAMTELNLARQEFNSATTRSARAAATIRLTQAEVAHNIALNQSTVAIGANTAAQNALNSSRLLGTRALALVGGPIGALTLGVTALAAGFLLMRDSSKDTQSALEEQGLTVDELKVKYSQLNAEQLKLRALGASDTIEAENEKIRSSFVSLERYISDLNGQGNTDQARALQQYLDELRVGGDSAKNAFARLENQKIGSPAVIEYAAKLGVTVKDSTKEIDKQKQILELASGKHIEHAKAAKIGAEGVAQVGKEAVSAAAKVKNLGEEVQKFINDSLNSTTDNLRKYQLISQGYTTATADMILAAEKAEGVNGTGGPLSVLSSSVLATQILSQKKLTDLVDERTEAEKKVNDELKKRKELLEKTVNSKTIDSVIARGEGNYNSFNKGKAGDSVGSKLNLVDMTVGQIRALQKNGSIFAAGKYQNIPSTLQGAIDAGIVSVAEKFNANVQERIVQQYLLTAKKDRGSIEDYIKSKSDNLYAANLDLAKEFASVASPVTGKSYYDGKAGNKASISVKEAQNALKASRELYTQAIASGKSAEEAWKAAFSGSISFVEGSDAQKGLEQLATYKEKLAEDRTALIEHYNLWQKLENDNAKQVKDIQEKFANDPVVRDRLLALQSKAYQEDVENYIKAGDDRVKADYQATQEIIAARQAAFDNINNPIYSMRDKGVEAIAQSSLSPLAYQKWDLNRQQQDGYSQLGDDLNTASMAINDSDILSEQEKKDKLLQIEQEYQDAKLALAQTYDQQHRDLEDQTHAASLAGYGAMFGMMGSMFDAYGDKESTGYKVAFAMQKAFVLSSAILNAKGAVMAAWNDPANTTIWQKMAAAAATVVQTNDLMSAIQGVALTGMAHDGIANVPEEGTWLLSKGERVLNPQDNKALTNMINNGGGGGDVTIQVSVTDSGVNTSGGNTQDQKQLALLIGNTVKAVLRKEKGQGGLLSK